MAASPYPLRLSAAPLWGNCPGALNAGAEYTDYPTTEKARGTAGHWVAEQVLGALAGRHAGSCSPSGWVGTADPAGTVVDDEIADGAAVYVSDVLRICQQYGATVRDLLVEFPVRTPRIHPTAAGGTLDCGLILPVRRHVVLWDYKAGRRRRVAVGDYQMTGYLEGLREVLQLDGYAEQQWTFEVRMVHPFSFQPGGPVSEWRGGFADLRAAVNKLADAVPLALAGAVLCAGPWCRDCPAVGRCPASRQYCAAVEDAARLPYAMDSMTGAELAVERAFLRDSLPVISARLDAIEAALKDLVSRGDRSSGLVLSPTEGRLNWTKPPAVVRSVAQQLGVTVDKPDALLTPTQAIDGAPAEVRAAFEQVVTGALAARKTTGLQLVPAPDSIAARAFRANQQTEQ